MSEKSASVSREVSLRRRKTASGYHYRRRSKALCTEQYSAELKHVLGLTLKTNCSFSCDPNSGLLAYPAGCVIVLYNPRQDKQTHIFNPDQKTLTCLKFSNDGYFIVTGEAGHRPCVRVFSVTDRCQVVAFSSHKFGISCVAFSPNGKYITSIGFQHDNVINVWDWKRNKLAASNKVSTKIKAVAFAGDGSHFITVGNRLVKYWYLEEPSADQVTVPLKGRSAILETLRNHVFCDVLCGNPTDQYTYAITRSGILCKLNCGRTVEKHVELKCGGARSICAINDMILCGCNTGSVHVYSANSLEFITEIFPLERLRGTEIIAISIDVSNMWLHCVFSDHSFVVHDVVDLMSPNVHALHQFHGSCVWDVKVLPFTSESDSLPSDCFLTCSNDGSVRAWQTEGDTCRLLKIVKLHKGIQEGDNNSSSKLEARSLCVRSDGKDLAIGDKSGNIHVYNLQTFEKVAYLPTHQGDVLGLDYSLNGDMLASASRDRCVHTFDSRYSPTHTIADHSAAVTSVKFAQHENAFRLITCGSDKSLYFCAITNNGGKTEITREQHFVEKHSMSDMAVLDDTVLLACGCNLSEYDVIGGKLRRTFRGNDASVGILRVAVNYHRTLVATSCADKHIYLLNFATGDILNVLTGHSEVAVALTFDAENRLLSSSADGCVFIWTLTRRVPDDFRNLQLHSNAPSTVTTPESPDLDRTAYFIDSKTTFPHAEEKATPQTMAGESFSVLFQDTQPKEDLKTETFQASQVTSEPKANGFDLPTWVTKSIAEESDTSPDFTPRTVFGKWGHRLEAEKICEELGNLPISVDLTSVRGSIDDESDLDDDVGGSSEDDSSTDQLTTEEFPEAEKPFPETVEILPTLMETQDTTITNSSSAESDTKPNTNAEKISNEIQVPEKKVETGDMIHEVLKPEDEKECKPQDPKLNSDALITVNAVNDIWKGPNETSVSETYAKSQPKQSDFFTKPEDPSNLPETDTSNFVNSHGEKDSVPISSNISPIPEKCKSSASNIITNDLFSDEDVDLRSHYFRTENVLQSAGSTVPHSKPEHDMHSTPKSHFSACVSIKLSSPSRSKATPKQSTLDSNASGKIDVDENTLHNVAVDEASTGLVQQVLSEVNESPIEDVEREIAENTDLQDQEHPANDTAASAPVALEIAQSNAENESPYTATEATTLDDDSAQTTVVEDMKSQEESETDSLDLKPCKTIEESSHKKSESLIRQEKRTPRPAAMPPAFAEFIASLKRKKPSKSLATSSSNALNSYSRRSDSSHASRTKNQSRDHLSRQSMPEVGVNRHLNEIECHSRSSSQSNSTNQMMSDHHLASDDEIDECQKVSDELMTSFNHAVTLYRKQQVLHESSEGLSNGTLDGYNKLIRTFQIIHSRLNRMKSVATDQVSFENPRPLSSAARSMSLNNLAEDSAVVSLLREYSDKLLGLVHTQADGKVYSSPADTV